jgi:carbonic anhydrase
VTAAVQGGHAPGHLGDVVDRIQPAVAASSQQAGDAVLNAIMANVRLAAATIRACPPILADAVTRGNLLVVGSLYHLDTAELELV